ncbi:hypothetical protein GCM10023321_33420 [Pseudonocardia eucalypti]|uniref:DUF559 domain-containing protein n=1 Tax=Pseudonocardia eucalypti TaxID=648755 RepID=A0ABP9Q5B3_9PSEU|nr:hypothetical protein [Pseudonocardia eucalypti]
MLTRHQLYGPRFQRVFPDIFLPASAPLDLFTRSRAAYLLVRDQGGALVGYSAAQLLDADFAPANAQAEVAAPRFMYRPRGLRTCGDRIEAADLVQAHNCRVTTPVRTAWDLARRVPLVEAVVAVDALARRAGFEPTDLLDYRAKHPGARGCRRLDRIVALADPRAESPPETRLRVGLVLEGLPTPETQYEILDEFGFLLAKADLAYPPARLAIEYDGRIHLERWRWERDRERDTRLAGYGWETLRFGHNDLRAIHQTASKVRGLLARRAPRPS